MKVVGNLVDLEIGSIYPAEVEINNKVISSIKKLNKRVKGYILPGLVDAHIHIESSLLPPVEFARIASVFGTVATVSDPHEIANVLGLKGVEFMINSSKKREFKTLFGASPCVPATPFESSGAKLGVEEIKEILQMDRVGFLSEVMNFPAVIQKDKEILAKIELAKKMNLPIDGHCPNLRGDDLTKYIEAGITTDHESSSLDEAIEKIKKGMKILIREGSAAKNFEALHPLIKDYPKKVMFCSDDLHPNDLIKGHINLLVKRALELGYELFDVLRVASINPIEHYNLDVGRLREGDRADFIVVDNLDDFNILKTVINGKVVAKNGKSTLEFLASPLINNFSVKQKSLEYIKTPECKKVRVIEVIDGELITNSLILDSKSDDLLKIVVVNRYEDKPVKGIGFIKGFGLREGAIASSVAHDSHNIVAVGCSDEEIIEAINKIISSKGGICAISKDKTKHLPLPIAGLMSPLEAQEVALKYEEIDSFAKELGAVLKAPFMSLSFMALLVIPSLKLSDKGLFDSEEFKFVSFCAN